MECIEFEEYVHVRQKSGVSLDCSQWVPLLANQACQNLQEMFCRKIDKALSTRDVKKLTRAVLLVAVSDDILRTIFPRKRKHVRFQGLVIVFMRTTLSNDRKRQISY